MPRSGGGYTSAKKRQQSRDNRANQSAKGVDDAGKESDGFNEEPQLAQPARKKSRGEPAQPQPARKSEVLPAGAMSGIKVCASFIDADPCCQHPWSM